MNYFELFNIPVSFKVDIVKLQRKFVSLQKKYHPDFFANASVKEQEEALQMSSLANKAIKILQSQEATIRYVLQLKGLLKDDEKYKLPTGFLMEVMELNELKMDGADDAELQQRTKALQNNIHQIIAPVLDNYLDDVTPIADLELVKEYYFKKKYLDRLATEPGI